ncbi:hypothetical protein [Acinetobacter vivianii]|uniref:hypothetical protein n=1 Tax=Acinetobacter vivianii TaxID=1776742 RepID=UPI003D00C084
MSSSTLSILHSLTQQFFEQYWNNEKLGDAPVWSNVHTNFGKIPNYDKQGVYAFVKGEEITYIGVGASKVSGQYQGHGLSNRFQKYCRWIDEANNIYGAVDERLKEAGAVSTIGFEQEHAHLAYALEIYLISRMQPLHNKVGR